MDRVQTFHKSVTLDATKIRNTAKDNELQIIKDYKSGENVVQMQLRHHISADKIYRILMRYGCEKRRDVTPSMQDKVLQYLDTHDVGSSTGMAKELKMNRTSIGKCLNMLVARHKISTTKCGCGRTNIYRRNKKC